MIIIAYSQCGDLVYARATSEDGHTIRFGPPKSTVAEAESALLHTYPDIFGILRFVPNQDIPSPTAP